MNRATVSVVIPTYNSAALVAQAIDSVLTQTIPPAEVIVVDDGSVDDTRHRLAAYGNRIMVMVQENQGVAIARNNGIRRARGDLIAFLDADDIWHPRKLEWQHEVLRQHSEVGLLGTGVFGWPALTLPEAAAAPGVLLDIVSWRCLAVKNYFTTSSILVRRPVLDKVGTFDHRLQGPEDHDLWLRVAQVSMVGNLRLPLTGYRSIGGSLSKQAVTMQAGMELILRKLDECQAWKGDLLLRRKAYGYLHYSCAYMHRASGDRRTALQNMLRSFAWYPFPFRRTEVRMALARPKMLLTLLRAARGETAFSAASMPADETTALAGPPGRRSAQ
jgi:glycosyltransferase involved in cell wall biosynthesis